jgi:hypothetical protein
LRGLQARSVLCASGVLCDGEGAGLKGLTPVMQEHSCVVSSEGGVKCWGSNTNGQVIIHARAIRFLRICPCSSIRAGYFR